MSSSVDADAGVYDVNVGGPVNLPKPHIIDAVWTDDYGREYHVVGRERLTAAEDEIARLTIDLAETERERQKVVEREAKTAEALTEARGRERDWRRVAEQHEEATRILGGGGSLPVLAQAAVDRAESLRAQLTEARHRLSDAVEYPGFPEPDSDDEACLTFVADVLDTTGNPKMLYAIAWCRARAAQQQEGASLRDEVEKAVAESIDIVIDFIHNHINTVTDIDAAKASMRPAIRDAVDAVLADLRGGDEQ